MQASNIEMFKKATLVSWNMQICQVLLDVQVSIFASWDRQDSTYASFEIATFRFSLDYKLAIFTIYKFRNIQVSKNFESKCKITFLCRLMIIASYCNVQVASLASWDIQDGDVQEDNFCFLK